jgi:N-acetylglutamate synthase-like GNAT family acetyltransferase
MTIRIGNVNDLQELNSISLKSKKYWGYPQEWIELWKDELTLTPEEISDHFILVVETRNRIVGFGALSETDEYFEIEHLWVLPEYMGKGIGSKLIKKLLSRVKMNKKPVIVISDPNAENFYKSHGFITHKKVESLPRGRFLPLMRKDSE